MKDAYMRRYGISSQQFNETPLDEILITFKIMEFENDREERENFRANQNSNTPDTV